jgi:hypothetical protein
MNEASRATGSSFAPFLSPNSIFCSPNSLSPSGSQRSGGWRLDSAEAEGPVLFPYLGRE